MFRFNDLNNRLFLTYFKYQLKSGNITQFDVIFSNIFKNDNYINYKWWNKKWEWMTTHLYVFLFFFNLIFECPVPSFLLKYKKCGPSICSLLISGIRAPFVGATHCIQKKQQQTKTKCPFFKLISLFCFFVTKLVVLSSVLTFVPKRNVCIKMCMSCHL